MKKRRQRLRTLAIVAGLCGLLAAPAAAQFGVTAGLNFNRLSDVTLNNAEATFESKSGWHVGIWTDISLVGVVTVRPGLRYLSAGPIFEGLSELDPDARDDFDVNLVEIPVLVRLAFGPPLLQPYVFLGPVVRFPANVDNTLDDDLESPNLGGEVGLGLRVSLGGLSLYPEVAYTFGLSSFIQDELILGFATFSTGDAQHLNTAMLRLGVGL